MKKLLLAFIFLITLNLSAQDDSYTPLTTEQQATSLKLSTEKVGAGVKYDSGMDYDGMFFWHVIAPDGKEYYFNSSNTFTDVKHEEASYSSLMEYVIEVIGF